MLVFTCKNRLRYSRERARQKLANFAKTARLATRFFELACGACRACRAGCAVGGARSRRTATHGSRGASTSRRTAGRARGASRPPAVRTCWIRSCLRISSPLGCVQEKNGNDSFRWLRRIPSLQPRRETQTAQDRLLEPVTPGRRMPTAYLALPRHPASAALKSPLQPWQTWVAFRNLGRSKYENSI